MYKDFHQRQDELQGPSVGPSDGNSGQRAAHRPDVAAGDSCARSKCGPSWVIVRMFLAVSVLTGLVLTGCGSKASNGPSGSGAVERPVAGPVEGFSGSDSGESSGSTESAVHSAVDFNLVAPIVWEKCSCCHREGEAAPFSLVSHQDVAERAQQIREVIESGYMPPWVADDPWR